MLVVLRRRWRSAGALPARAASRRPIDLALADAWLARAEQHARDPEAFLDPPNGLTETTAGPVSIYHSPTGWPQYVLDRPRSVQRKRDAGGFETPSNAGSQETQIIDLASAEPEPCSRPRSSAMFYPRAMPRAEILCGAARAFSTRFGAISIASGSLRSRSPSRTSGWHMDGVAIPSRHFAFAGRSRDRIPTVYAGASRNFLRSPNRGAADCAGPGAAAAITRERCRDGATAVPGSCSSLYSYIA